MSATHGAAAHEEQAELRSLRDEADKSTAEVARTLTELTGRLAAGRPKAVARRLAANARVTALRAVREGPGKIAGQRGAKRLALAAIPVLLLATAAAIAVARERLKTQNPDPRLRPIGSNGLALTSAIHTSAKNPLTMRLSCGYMLIRVRSPHFLGAGRIDSFNRSSVVRGRDRDGSRLKIRSTFDSAMYPFSPCAFRDPVPQCHLPQLSGTRCAWWMRDSR